MLSFVKIGPVVLEKTIFKFVNIFTQFRNYLPLEKSGAFHLNKPESPSPRNDLRQVWLNWPNGSGEEDFKICQCIIAIP